MVIRDPFLKSDQLKMSTTNKYKFINNKNILVNP